MSVKITKEITEAMNALLRKTGSKNSVESMSASLELAEALTTPLRQGVMNGDITSGIFEIVDMSDGRSPEFPLDFLAPGTEKDFIAYTIPKHGRLPERNIEGDYVTVPMFEVGNTIDWQMKYSRDARWDVVSRAMNVMIAGFIKKKNDDCWHTLLTAILDRNIMVYDADATAGQFTKRLVSLGKTVMRRNGGGNSTSTNRGMLTDMFISPEGMEDMRNWNVDQVDEVTRREIYTAADGTINRIFSINLHDLDELGESQEYQNFFTGSLGGSLATGGDVELAIGLDLRANDSFIMPLREDVQVYPADDLLRQRRNGFWATTEYGVACLDNRRAIALSF